MRGAAQPRIVAADDVGVRASRLLAASAVERAALAEPLEAVLADRLERAVPAAGALQQRLVDERVERRRADAVHARATSAASPAAMPAG